GIDFVFVRIIRADSRDKRSGSNVFFVNEKLCRGRAGHNEVAASDRLRRTAGRFDVDRNFARKFCSKTQRCVWIDIKRVNFAERKDETKRAKLRTGLLATTTDRRD